MKNPEQLRGIDWESILRVVWGAILPHLSTILRGKSAQVSKEILPEKIRDLIASLIGAGAQIFEKEFKGVHFEILSDIFEQISAGVKLPVEEKEKARPEERRQRYEWPTLEELEGIAKGKEVRVKRELLLKFSSSNLKENIEQLSDKEIEDLIDVLIQIEKARRELAKIGIRLDLKSVFEMLKQTFSKIVSITGKGLKEVSKYIKENYPKLKEYLDKKANKLAEQIESVRESKEWRLI